MVFYFMGFHWEINKSKFVMELRFKLLVRRHLYLWIINNSYKRNHSMDQVAKLPGFIYGKHEMIDS